MNFDNMIKSDNKFHIYAGQYIDLVMGCGVSVCYIQHNEKFLRMAQFLESTTINHLELFGLAVGLSGAKDTKEGAPFVCHINSPYTEKVLLHCGSWRNQNIIEEKAYPSLVKMILECLDSLGEGEIELTRFHAGRDDMMIHLMKYAKHCFHRCQMEIIERKSTKLPSGLFPVDAILIKDLPGSVLWKTPLSHTQFQAKMQKSRIAPVLQLVQK